MKSFPSFCPEVEFYYMPVLEKMATLLNWLASNEGQNNTHGEIEQRLWNEGIEALRLGFQGHLDQRYSSEEKLKTLDLDEDGTSRTYGRPGCTRQLETQFGTVVVSRIGYEGQDLKRIFPMDEMLSLPLDKYSHGVRRTVVEQIINGAFDAAKDHLDRLGGGRMPKRQIEEMAVKLSRDFEIFYELPLFPSPILNTDVLVLTFDGKGIVMHPDALRDCTREAAKRDEEKQKGKKKRRLNPGEKNNRKRMATVVSVYDVPPHPRTPEQIFFSKEDKKPKRPKPKNKRVWAGVVGSQRELVEQGFREAMRHDPNHERVWVALIDGQDDLIRQVEACKEIYRPDLIVVQDFVHAIEYLWKAAHVLHNGKEEAETREKWIGDRGGRLLEGRAKVIASGLRRAASRKGLSNEEAKPVLKAAEYFEKNHPRMRYDEALSLGLPIATGVIEGACRHLVKDRMDITGARWALDRAEAILKLRAIKISGDLDEYLDFHFKQEKQRNYSPSMISKSI